MSALPLEQRGELSPAEKFDLLRGDASYTLTQAARRESDFSAVSWAGLCHGWAQAALAYEEPQPKVVRGAGGFDIPFASSDLKALLSYWMGEASDGRTRFVGRRCDTVPDGSPACNDLDAGAFHVVLANLLGRAGRGFVVDFDPGRPIWNYPVHAYTTRVVGTPSPGSVEVETVVRHPSLARPRAVAYAGKPDLYSETTVRLRYRLELDGQRQIVGGTWLVADHPDFLWTQEVKGFAGIFAPLRDLVNPIESSSGG